MSKMAKMLYTHAVIIAFIIIIGGSIHYYNKCSEITDVSVFLVLLMIALTLCVSISISEYE